MSRLLPLGVLVVAGIILATQLLADDPAVPSLPSRPNTPDYDTPPLAPPVVPMQPTPDNGPNIDFQEKTETRSYSSHPPMNSRSYGSTYDQVDSAPIDPSEPLYGNDSVDSGIPVYSNPSDHTPAVITGPVYSGAPLEMFYQYGPSQPMSAAPAVGCGCHGGMSMGYVNAPTPYEVGGGTPYTGAFAGGTHVRHPFYSYRAPWYYRGPASRNVTIVW